MHKTFRLFRYAFNLIALLALLLAPGANTQAETTSQGLRMPAFPASFQQSKKVSNEEQYSSFGSPIAISGDILVAGNAINPSVAGQVLVFEKDFDPGQPDVPKADNWGLVKALAASDGGPVDYFGRSVAVSGDIVVIGAPFKNGGSGAVYIFARDYDPAHPSTPLPNNWGQVKKLTAGQQNQGFGAAVTISGDTLAVGASCSYFALENCPPNSAYIYSRDYDPAHPETPSAGNWGLVKKIVNNDFMDSIDIENDLLAAGTTCTHFDLSTGECGPGAAYLYGRDYDPAHPGTPLANNWGLIKQFNASDQAQGDFFGISVAVSGDSVAVGAPRAPFDSDTGESGPGAAYVFSRDYDPAHPGASLPNNWGEVKKLAAPDGNPGDAFGFSLDMRGSTLVIGATDHPASPGPYPVSGPGALYVFDRRYDPAHPDTITGNYWGLAQELVAEDGQNGDYFTNSVALSKDTLVAGAPLSANYTGSVYVFKLNLQDAFATFLPLATRE